ncbi:hexokinase [Desulforamulus ferrireducens]|uniref:Hexokinase n=1 Tax=Desulforamulus ferrireducens TaxID=1833852 RepID=A0A1S6IVQ6_9FIRM|nr:hexokinase [Desulforamulus ferrireducens]AQS58833.1 hexokinase [Desulforamulus ferrireducens]
MTRFSEKIQTLTRLFLPTAAELTAIAEQFKQEMTAGLGGKGSLKMLRSYLSKPTGQEKGQYITIDFGGTNIRLQLVELLGSGNTRIKVQRSFPLKEPAGFYDYTSSLANAEDLFDFIASQLGELLEDNRPYLLGHTFSFPSEQLTANRAVLLSWTKEIKTAGMEGQEITSLLEAALIRKNLHQVKPTAIINDTTGTLLTAAYRYPQASIGSICGTGHNTCYLEPQEPSTGEPMIINLESGNFHGIPLTPYDIALDQASEKPGQQLLEKAVAGQYLGELARLILLDLWDQPQLLPPYSLKTQDLATFLGDHSKQFTVISSWLQQNCPELKPSQDNCAALRMVAELVTTRSAKLVAATYAGVLKHMDPELNRQHFIAVDGSLFEKMPSYQEHIKQSLVDILGEKVARISLGLVKDGSGTGAAIAAASCGA